MGSKAQFVNVYPFIWNDFAKNGYATGWGEDLANVGTFTYRLKGFQVSFSQGSVGKAVTFTAIF